MNILVLNGPNLNLLGTREPEVYGTDSLKDIEDNLKSISKKYNVNIRFYQSNSENELINELHTAKQQNVDAIIINPGAFTHTSIALRDAFLGVDIPFIEVHISNIYRREEFRKKSPLACKAAKQGHSYIVNFSGKAGFVYVQDVVNLVEMSISQILSGALILNVNGITADVSDLIKLIKKNVPLSDIGVKGNPLSIVGEIRGNEPSKIFKNFKYTSLEDGIKRTIDFY